MGSRYFFTAAMDIPFEKEALFDDVYNTEHIPYLSEVSGVLSIARFTTQPLRMVMGGEEKEIVIADQPKHTAVYELASPDVLLSAEWSDAVDKGRWSADVRQHTYNRRHVLLKETEIR